MSNFPIVVFDLGAVLIHWDPRLLYRKIFQDEAEMEFFLREVATPQWNHEIDAGRSPRDAIRELAEASAEKYKTAILSWVNRWSEMLGGAVEPMVNVLEHLHQQGRPLHAITNWSAETFPYAQERFEFLKRFQSITVSGKEKLAKPDPRIFELFLARNGFRATDCVFIDDAPRNVETAHALGFQTVHFQEPTQAIRALAEVLKDDSILQFLP
jgi:2-haloacid dehalogenase